MNLSPEGDLGGVYPLGDICAVIFDMNMGEGGAINEGPGL
jgi:hypothetical protein